jgi:gliding motility-associated-like protein
MKRILFLFLILFNCAVNAQLVIDNTTQTPQQLVQSVVVGQGINVSNIKFNGSATSANIVSDQVGLFTNGATTNIDIDKGIILSTGNSAIAVGPNDRDLATLPTSNPFVGDNDLYILSNNQVIKNVAILEFDFVPTGNKLSFNFVFASEEYPEFVNDSYNDNFGFFLSGPGIAGPFSGGAKNIALIPSTTLPVSINNLNNGNSNTGPCEYCLYYVNNEGGTSIQYDGFTKILAANADVECGQTYHIKLAIANVGDNNYDSAVFIEGASFSSSGINLGSDVKLCSATDYTLKTGLNTTEIHEWKKDGIVIPTELGPNLLVTQTGTYSVKAFPFGVSCPVSDEIKVEFNTVKPPLISCGTKTTNSIQFNWGALTDATVYSVSYQVESNPAVNVGTIGNVTTYTVNGLNSGESVKITVTPIGIPVDCFASASQSCSLTPCVNPTITPTFTAVAPICEGTILSPLPIKSNNNITGSWSPTLNNAATTEYTFTPDAGQCATQSKLTITVNPITTPTFTAIAPICEGTIVSPLPIKSNNNITGSWSPALNNTATTEYTFTPDAGQCASQAKLTITVNPITTPTFTAIAPICEGTIVSPLPIKSNNNITGSWSPTLNNAATTEYTFTPDAEQCANSSKLTITVNPITTPTFAAIAPICEGTILSPLPIKSNNNMTGFWSPTLNNTFTTEYTFTPDAGQCANPVKLTITVNLKTNPVFTAIAPICEEEILTALPLQSNNNITGSWSPALNNIITTEYTFTPDAGQCANPSKSTILVNPKPIPLLKDGIICIEKNTNAIIQSYIFDSKLNNTAYNFEWFLNGNKINNAIESTLEATQKGTYAVIATNKITNCTSKLVQATVQETFSNSTTIEITQTNAFSNDATVIISIVQGTGNYEYQLDQEQFQLSNIFSKVPAGAHIVNIRDTNGCTDLGKEIVVVGYPKFFTPNGDGHNDIWNIIGFSSQSNPVIYIFDRYGKLLKQFNSTDLGWDGTYNGHQMPATDYWFKVIYFEDGINKEFKSHFSLKR